MSSSNANTIIHSYGLQLESSPVTDMVNQIGATHDYPAGIRRLDSAAPSRAVNSSAKKLQNTNKKNASPPQRRNNLSYLDNDGLQNLEPASIIHPEDTLEYFIKFPTTNYRNGIDVPDSDYVFVYKESNVPIVMLLGWAGCQDRYLMKYSKIYEDRGLITVRYTAPVDTLFWNRTAMVPIGEKILKLIYDMNFDGHPIIFHIFSNGGAYLYQHISLAARKHKTPIQIRGMIFDSAPGERRVLGLYRAVHAIYGKEKRKCYGLTAFLITMTLSIMWFVEETFAAFKSLFVKVESTQTNPFCGLKNEPNAFPQMFLYSKGDVVIPFQDIEKFIKIREQQGVQVSSVCFEDAEHVKIYTKYPSEYIRCICTFINNCLSMPFKRSDSYATTTPSSVASSNEKYD